MTSKKKLNDFWVKACRVSQNFCIFASQTKIRLIMAEFRILSAAQYDAKLRVRIQNTGRLGFGDDTAKGLDLTEDTYIKFATLESGKDTLLYMSVSKNACKEAFKVNLYGKYFNVATQRMFDALGYDYANETISFDLVRKKEYDADLDGTVWEMKRRKVTPKSDNSEDDDMPDENTGEVETTETDSQ